MLNFLFLVYSRTILKERNILNRLTRFTIKIFLNIFIPIYFSISRKESNREVNVIVSFTTFPQRIDRAWIIVESMLRQTFKPQRIVLTLSRQQFPYNKNLPKKLLNLEKRKLLEIIWTDDDLRSHKKYYYVMKKYPNDVVITIDDDFIYADDILENLYKFHLKFPNCIITNLALERCGKDYNDWKNLLFKEVEPTFNIMQFGGSGVLYPASSLHMDAFDKNIIQTCCPLADDIWLNAMAILGSTKIVKTNYRIYPIPLIFRDNFELYELNVLDNKNNKQIIALEEKYGLFLCSK
ncbi:hypothetical protein B9T24_14500 [Acinetobacter sp. ANC 4654]|uniref:hypothetical protein n=1 Tax=Acinetobacter sp. ANC 4654 TaxID=1977872 RepID=UPI000A32B6A0|nr:hypothetical protein [Acinetobacter sp. ANC 4654]OTG93176.1 hypothetical protein B9T24_14500 [Acinetobacter sp. ANC 4654]